MENYIYLGEITNAEADAIFPWDGIQRKMRIDMDSKPYKYWMEEQYAQEFIDKLNDLRNTNTPESL